MTEPAYSRVAGELRTRIREGEFADGIALPTEATLSAHYGVSRQTIRRAFQDLVADGLVHRTRGRGTFVASTGDLYVTQLGSIDDLMALSRDTRMEVLRPLTRVVDVSAAGRLGTSTDVVSTIDLVRSHAGVLFCFTRLWLAEWAAAILEGVPELALHARSSATVIGLLDTRLPDRIVQAQQSLTAESAPEHVSEALGCEQGAPTLRADRLYLDADDRGAELAISHFLPDHYSYRTHLRRTR